MNQKKFSSIFADEIDAYLTRKVASGFKEKSYVYHLKAFDRFCMEQGLDCPVFTKDLADEWIKERNEEASTTHYSRINTIKHFLSYLNLKGLDVFITKDIRFIDTQFKPHIYTEDEIVGYFEAVDTFESTRNRKTKVQYPVLFRLLYCCGARINETIGIKKKDVDLENGIIRLLETKNNCERFIVLSDDLLSFMRKFAERSFYLLGDEDYIFTSANGGRLHGTTLHDHHVAFLAKAGIPFLGGGEGPRIQDWRHSFSVYSFKQMIDSGIDMYVALPILSAYLGHKTIYATERYLHLTTSLFPYLEKKVKGKLDYVFAEVDHENN